MLCGITQRHSCWHTEWLAILQVGWSNTIALDVQLVIKEMEKKLHDKQAHFQTAVCKARGKEEVNKVMAVRAQVCLPPSAVPCTYRRLSTLARLCLC